MTQSVIKGLNNLNKHKKALMAGAIVSGSSLMADVTFTPATKEFAGTFDLAPFYSAIGIIITAVAVVAGIQLAIKSFRRVG